MPQTTRPPVELAFGPWNEQDGKSFGLSINLEFGMTGIRETQGIAELWPLSGIKRCPFRFVKSVTEVSSKGFKWIIVDFYQHRHHSAKRASITNEPIEIDNLSMKNALLNNHAKCSQVDASPTIKWGYCPSEIGFARFMPFYLPIDNLRSPWAKRMTWLAVFFASAIAQWSSLNVQLNLNL